MHAAGLNWDDATLRSTEDATILGLAQSQPGYAELELHVVRNTRIEIRGGEQSVCTGQVIDGKFEFPEPRVGVAETELDLAAPDWGCRRLQ